MINTIDKSGIKRTLSLNIYNSLPENTDGSRGQNHIRPENPILEIDSVSNEIADFITSKKKIEVVNAVEEIKVDEVTSEPIEKKVVAVKKTCAKRGANKK